MSAVEVLKEMRSLFNESNSWEVTQERDNALYQALLALEQKEKLKEFLIKEEQIADKVLVNLENRNQQRLDWDKWWEELKNNYIDYAKKIEVKRLIKEVLELMK